MKPRFAFLLIIGLAIGYQETFAQTVLQESKKLKFLYLGMGLNFPDKTFQQQANFAISGNFQVNIYQKFLHRKRMSLGLNAGVELNSNSTDQITKLPAPFHVVDETSSVTVFNSFVKSPKFPPGVESPSQSCKMLALGPQAEFLIAKKWVLSPIFQIGYMHIVQKEFNVIQKTRINTWPYDYILFSQSQNKTNGLAIIPKLRIQYYMRKNLGFWVEVNYCTGPEIRSSQTTFSPEGNPNSDGKYDLSQMQSGTFKSETLTTGFKTIGVNFGIFGGSQSFLKKDSNN